MLSAFSGRPRAGAATRSAALRSQHRLCIQPLIPNRRVLPVCCGIRQDHDRPDLSSESKIANNPETLAPGKGHQRIFLTTLLASGVGGIMGLLPELEGPISTLQAILILCAIVAFHELGHFTAARVQGIHVSKFAIGFGPSLWRYKPGDVEYSVRAFPLGGFVAFPDNDEDCPYPEDDPNLLKNRPIADRFWVISAGVFLMLTQALFTPVCFRRRPIKQRRLACRCDL